MTFDFHTHTFPQKIAAAALEKLSAASHSPAFCDGTAEGLRRSMKEGKIDFSVVLPVATNPEKVVKMNTVSIEENGRDGLLYFGCMHPDFPDFKKELRRLAAEGLRGIKIHPVYQGCDIDDIRFLRILSAAGEEDLAVVMHAGDDIGFPGAVRAAPEQIARARKQLGKMKLILAHMGGWKNWDRVQECLADSDVMLDTSFSLGRIPQKQEPYYSPEEERLLSAEIFCDLVRAFGSERILFGTDSPWTDQKMSVEAFLALPLTQKEKDDVLCNNARRILCFS
ncbi:MAG: amidohydrolase family protein [Clostridia bacterium]|nr:amidohydrolase family protein [Clostridia bacterium]